MAGLGWLAFRFGRHSGGGIEIKLRLTHQEISEFICSSRITVTRLLGQLEGDGLLQRAGPQTLVLLAPLEKFITVRP